MDFSPSSARTAAGSRLIALGMIEVFVPSYVAAAGNTETIADLAPSDQAALDRFGAWLATATTNDHEAVVRTIEEAAMHAAVALAAALRTPDLARLTEWMDAHRQTSRDQGDQGQPTQALQLITEYLPSLSRGPIDQAKIRQLAEDASAAPYPLLIELSQWSASMLAHATGWNLDNAMRAIRSQADHLITAFRQAPGTS